jgi:hypothetical protein
LAVALVPVIWLLAWRWARSPRSVTPLVAAAVLLALLLMTSFYVGWFMLFVSGLGAVVGIGVVVAGEGWPSAWRRMRAAASGSGRPVLYATLAFVIVISPMLAVYLPALRSVGGRGFEFVVVFTPKPWQAVDVGPENLVWGSIVRFRPSTASVFSAGELRRGWPPLLLCLFAASVLVASRRWMRHDRRLQSRSGLLVVTLGLTAIVAWLLISQYRDVTAWRAVWALVPGAAAIRVVVRIAHVLNVLVIAVAMAGIAMFLRPDPRTGPIRRWRVVAVVLLAIALLVEQLNLAPIAQLSRDAEQAKFARVGPPLPGCRDFYVVRAPTKDLFPSVEGQIDAMLVAYEYLLPTINGYSGNVPPGWNLSFEDDAVARARAWAVTRRVRRGLCVLDLETGTWSRDVRPTS